jgi:hypothetical protein
LWEIFFKKLFFNKVGFDIILVLVEKVHFLEVLFDDFYIILEVVEGDHYLKYKLK